MSTFWLSFKFAMSIYVLATFITLLVLGLVKIIKKITE